METSIVGHYMVRLSWFLNLLTWRAVSLSLLLRLCPICERTEEEPALVRAWVKQGLTPLGSATFPGNTCWWPPSTGKLQRVHPASQLLLSHEGV